MKTLFKKKILGKVHCFECEYFKEWSAHFGNCIHESNLIDNDIEKSKQIFIEKNKNYDCKYFKKCNRKVMMNGLIVKEVVKLTL